jgi:HSP20 family molecular chaperone IbpA
MTDFSRQDRPEKSDSAPRAAPVDVSRGISPERRLCAPPIDIYETEGGLVLCADLPGVTAEGLELHVQDNKLTLFGRVHMDVPPDAKRLHQEYHVCDFLRSFILSDEVDHERISAKINNGVLEVILPEAERPKPRRIEVRTD